MKKLIKNLLILAAVVSIVLPEAQASVVCDCKAPIDGGPSKQTTTRWYAGLIWELGGNQGLTPDIVLGVRTLTVRDVDSVSGGDANLRLKIKDSVSLDSVRLAYVGGKPSVLANAGLGYSFTHSTPIATAAIQGSYLRLSTDYLFAQNKFQFFGEINTLKKPDTVGNGQLSCSSPYQLLEAAAVPFGTVPSSAIVNGKTCYNSTPG
jgi:hypothetical protein